MRSLLTLPLRVARGTIELEVWLAKMALGVARGVLDPGSTRVPPPAPGASWPDAHAQPMQEPPRPQGDKLDGAARPAPGPPRRARARRAPARRAARPRPVAAPEPAPVASVGPSAHAGAEVHVDAPWEGYDEMALQDILGRLENADEAAVAVVRLYESQHENRQAILLATGAEP
ncbi:MAG TPA: hypothetical protein VFT42_01615 [Solirubrobacteraceae bacterium]|nr:hypothetical protein [Solirubrobacteraceae bacterium]